MRSFFVLAGAFALAACSSDTFTTPDGSAPDATADALDDRPLSDVAVPEAGDGGPTDAPTGDGSVPPLDCTNAPADAVFCADFNGGGAIDQGWTSSFVLNGGTVAPNTTSYWSSPRSFLSSLPVTGGLAYAQLFENYTETGTATRYALSFWFRVTTTDSANAVRIARLEYPSSLSNSKVRIDVDVAPSTNVTLDELGFTGDGGILNGSHKLGNFTPNKWHHVELVFKLSAPMSVQATIDGQTQQFSPVVPPPATNVTKFRDVFVGTYANSGVASPIAISFDDVLYRAF